MVFDSRANAMVVFGGFTTGYSNETWRWDNSDWSQFAPITFPSAREGAGIAYDPLFNRIVLFGGEQGNAFLADTWEF